jgi:hypothetical protein
MTDEEMVAFAASVVGKRYSCDFRVRSVGPGHQAILTMHGDSFTISLEELHTIITRGFVVEVWESLKQI